MSTPSVNPSDRVQVIPNPIASPGQCGICGKPEHLKGFIDPQLNFDFYGTLIFCYDCVVDMCTRMGCFAPDELNRSREPPKLWW